MKNLRKFIATATLAAAFIITPALSMSAQAGVLIGSKATPVERNGVIIHATAPEKVADDSTLLKDVWYAILGIILC